MTRTKKPRRVFQSPRREAVGPLRDIVSTLGAEDGGVLDLLSCGHAQRARKTIFGRKAKARRRRCGFCGEEARRT